MVMRLRSSHVLSMNGTLVLVCRVQVRSTSLGGGPARLTVPSTERFDYNGAPKNEQARVSPSTEYQCIHGGSTVHRL